MDIHAEVAESLRPLIGSSTSLGNLGPEPVDDEPIDAARLDVAWRKVMEVWDVRQEDEADEPLCQGCGRRLVKPEDVEAGLHFFCVDFTSPEAMQDYVREEEAEAEAEWQREREEMDREAGFPDYYDEGGESG